MALMDIRPALVEFLYGDATIYGIVGGGVTKANGGRRIDPLRVRQGIREPSIVYQEISGQGDHHNEGPSGLARPRMQVAAWAVTADAAHALALAIKFRLDGYKGTMGSGATLVTVQGAFFNNWRDEDDTVADLRGKISDYIINFEER